jgi:hypothetical protein
MEDYYLDSGRGNWKWILRGGGPFQWVLTMVCVTLRITKFLDFVHRAVFKKIKEHNVSETESVSLLRSEGGEREHLVSWVP